MTSFLYAVGITTLLTGSLLASTLSLADTAQDTQLIFKQLAQHSTVRAEFVQQKQLPSINKTFQSRGSLTFSKSAGVLWRIKAPVHADLIMTPVKLVQKTERTQSQIAVDKSPYGGVANVFLQLMSGDQKTLDKNFTVQSVTVNRQVQPASWTIRLVPKSTMLKKLFNSVDASGDQYVQRMSINEKGNSNTVIQFSQQQNSPAQLTANENALFQLAK